MALSKGVGDGLSELSVSVYSLQYPNCLMPYLQDLLIFLCLAAMDLFHRGDVLLEIATSMFPCLQTLSEQSSSLHRPSQL